MHCELRCAAGAGGQTGGQRKPLIGELALVPPLLGSSQRLLNKDHFQVYYEVGAPACLLPYCNLTTVAQMQFVLEILMCSAVLYSSIDAMFLDANVTCCHQM